MILSFSWKARFVCQNILLIAQGWAGENEKSCFLIYTIFLSNGSDGFTIYEKAIYFRNQNIDPFKLIWYKEKKKQW